MFPVIPSIDPRLVNLAPGFRALSISVRGAEMIHPEVGAAALAHACQTFTTSAPWAEAHLQAWAEVFRRFGAKPQRTPCSADALRKRVLRDGTMANIDPVVDLYNAVSIRYAIAVGGENAAAYVGTPTLTLADGSELFDTIKEGAPAHEHPDAGEVVWRDDLGVTCRRWNWRQGVRTRLDAHAKEMWFILESLPEMPLDALHAAGEELMSGLRQMMPGAEIESMLVGV